MRPRKAHHESTESQQTRRTPAPVQQQCVQKTEVTCENRKERDKAAKAVMRERDSEGGPGEICSVLSPGAESGRCPGTRGRSYSCKWRRGSAAAATESLLPVPCHMKGHHRGQNSHATSILWGDRGSAQRDEGQQGITMLPSAPGVHPSWPLVCGDHSFLHFGVAALA